MILRKAYALCILLLCLCLMSAGAASAEETYASLAEKLGGKVICTACGEEADFVIKTSTSYHYTICRNESCSRCGIEYSSTHYPSCQDSSVCGVCGTAYTGSSSARHVYLGMPYLHSERYHWQACALCGDESSSSKYSHKHNCTEDACSTCGEAVNSYFSIVHSPDGIYLSDETQHWQTCLACGEACSVSSHSGSCSDGLCDTCGVSFTDKSRMYHTYDYNQYVPNPDYPDYHGRPCTTCSYVSKYSTHSAVCTEPTVCSSCGADYAGTSITHTYDKTQFVPNPDYPDYHGYLCTACGIVSRYTRHSAVCTDPTVCSSCGVDYTGTWISHSWQLSVLVPDPEDPENFHGNPCQNCDEIGEKREHFQDCANPGVCMDCGTAYTGYNWHHTLDSSQYIIDPDAPDYHGYLCTVCGLIIPQGVHVADCSAPGTCKTCGYEDRISRVDHTYDYSAYVPNPDEPDYHGYLCKVCGVVSKQGMHSAACDAPDLCSRCGTAYAGSNITHTLDYDQYVVNPDEPAYHGYLCTACGIVSRNTPHAAACDAPGVCGDCGVEYHGGRIDHNLDTSKYLACTDYPNHHGYLCMTCGLIESVGTHYADCTNPGVCAICGVPYTGSDVSHTLDYSTCIVDPDNPARHGYLCRDCGKAANTDIHEGSCTDPGVCYGCGIAYSGSEIHHNLRRTDYVDCPDYPGWHGFACIDCGVVEPIVRHASSCAEPGVCSRCGAEYDGAERAHTAPSTWSSNESCHWMVCSDCGEIFSVSYHRADCLSGDACETCGHAVTTDTVIQLYHFWNGVYQHDEENHWRACSDCGEIFDLTAHSANCSAPGICEDCGADYAGENISHEFDYDSWAITESGHSRVCKFCSAVDYTNEHYASCAEPDVCQECGYQSDAIETQHNSERFVMGHDAYMHWYLCTDCGVYMQADYHRAYCYAPGVCRECGAACSAAETDHTYGHGDTERYVITDNGHGRICLYCGKTNGLEEHYVTCDNPGVCRECGAACSSPSLQHDWDSGYQSNDEQHWRICTICGEAIHFSDHFASCTAPGVCEECGYSGDIIIDNHTWSREFLIDENMHARICADCGESLGAEEHARICAEDAAICFECGAAYTGDNLHHIPDRDGGYLTDNTSHWYACMLCGEKARSSLHYDENADGLCDECYAELTDVPPEFDATTHSTLFMTAGAYGRTALLWAYNRDAVQTGALSIESSDPDVLTAEFVKRQYTASLFTLTALKPGTATLTLTAPNGLTASMDFTVEAGGQEVILPEGTTEIREEAFAGMTAAEFIYVPEGVTTIGDRAFAGCENLRLIFLPASAEEIGQDILSGCESAVIAMPQGSAAHIYANEHDIMTYILQ